MALNARVGRAGEDEDAGVAGGGALAVVDSLGGHQGKEIGVAGAVADGHLARGQDIGFASLGFRFGGVEPPGVGADIEERVPHQAPVILARGGAESVVESHSRGMKCGDLGAVNKIVELIHFRVDHSTRGRSRAKPRS